MVCNALRLNDLVLKVHLGCEAAERAHRQEVRVALEIRFSEQPLATQSDQLSDTLCYAKLSEMIIGHCEVREYHLIERLAAEIYQLARELTAPSTMIAVKVHKVRPPVERLAGGSLYTCGDFLI